VFFACGKIQINTLAVRDAVTIAVGNEIVDSVVVFIKKIETSQAPGLLRII